MTMRLFMVLFWSLASICFFVTALMTSDVHKRQTRLLFAIWCALMEISKVLGAIAIHTGAYPLWNNK